MLHLYKDIGCKFIRLNPDKSPNIPGCFPLDESKKKFDKSTGEEKKNYDWHLPENQIDFEAAKHLQNIGEGIGAITPENIIIIDIDRHQNSPDGVEIFKKIKDDRKFTFDILASSFSVQTPHNGFHIYFKITGGHDFTQCELAPGIELKTHKSYRITAGSPGYRPVPKFSKHEICEIPEELLSWITEIQNQKYKKKKPGYRKEEKTQSQKTLDSKKIPSNLLEKILKKLDVLKFDNNDKWQNFITSAIAACGDSPDVIKLLSDWSAQDTRYKEDQTDRIKSFSPDGGITTGTFIHILKENGISNYFVKKINSFDISFELYENMRDDGSSLPFPEPDYNLISESKEAHELFLTCGNSSAATILEYATSENIIYVESEKEFYIFDGNKWIEFYDMFSVCYTILIRLSKFMYANRKGDDIDNENFIKLVRLINKTHWKRETINEYSRRSEIYKKTINWDSVKYKETLTCIDGVIDFTTKDIIVKNGLREEYRKSYVPYKADDIIKSNAPEKYNKFLSELFPDHDTMMTAREASSLYISGNAKKVFQIFHGPSGDNGKSTWLELEAELLGQEKAETFPTEIIMSNKYGNDELPPQAARFEGKFLLYGQETSKGKQLSLGRIKNLTGNDSITAKALYKMPKTFLPTWQMVFSTNDLPFFDGSDHAFINRLLILPFEKTFVWTQDEKDALINRGFKPELIGFKIDDNILKNEIRQEFPAVIKQKIQDYIVMKYEHGGKIIQSKKCLKHKKSYIAENNDIESFLMERCEVSISKGYFTTTEELLDACQEYTGNAKLTSKALMHVLKQLRQELTPKTKSIKSYIYDPSWKQTEKIIQKRGLLNIRLKTPDEIEEFLDRQEEIDDEKDKKYNDEIPF